MMGIPESQYAFVFDRTNIILGAGDPEYVARSSRRSSRRCCRPAPSSPQLVQELGARARDEPDRRPHLGARATPRSTASA